jgi:hypothetical protein
MKRFARVFVFFLLGTSLQAGELAYVGGGHIVDLQHFTCTDNPASKYLRRVCYDEVEAYLLVELQETWLHYCGVKRPVVSAFISAPSVASFYNSKIRSGPFNCRGKSVPSYD